MFDSALSLDFVLRIILAGFLGALFGIERDLNARPAGIRTLMIISIGACLFGIISGEGYADAEGVPDPTRIASIVVQGIGFIGAGVLLKGDHKVLGLTTASTIWLTAGVGLAVGAGMEAEATVVAAVSLVALFVLGPLSFKLEAIGKKRMEKKGVEVVKEK
jgi:putative Mg2+ transporter-C (MgtC) family protein